MKRYVQHKNNNAEQLLFNIKHRNALNNGNQSVNPSLLKIFFLLLLLQPFCFVATLYLVAFSTIPSRPVPFEDFYTALKYFCTCNTILQLAGLIEDQKGAFSWHYNTYCYVRTKISAWMQKRYGKPSRVSFKLGLQFLCHAELLAELEKKHDRYWLRLSTPKQLCLSSSRLQPVSKM